MNGLAGEVPQAEQLAPCLVVVPIPQPMPNATELSAAASKPALWTGSKAQLPYRACSAGGPAWR